MTNDNNNDAARARFVALLAHADIASNGESTDSSNQLRAALSSKQAAPGLPSGVSVHFNPAWINYQGNLLPMPVLRQYSMTPLPAGEKYVTDFKTGVERVCAIVKDSAEHGGGLRAVGSSWSSSRICQTPTNMIECSTLAGLAPGIPSSHLAAGIEQSLICHLHGGTTIDAINKILEARKQSLQVMGGNAGQNIAGIVATGTHGSWIDRHAVADSLLAIALVSAGGRRYWIESKSRPLTNDKFGAWENFFEVIRDDDVFAAAQVSHGALGVVTSVVLSVNPLYKVHFTRSRREWDKPLQQAVFSHDLDLRPILLQRPAHFEVVLNPYQLGAGQKGVFMETGYVVSSDSASAPPSAPPGSDPAASGNPYDKALSDHIRNNDWDWVAKFLSAHPSLIPPTLDILLPIVFKPETTTGYLSQVWPLSTGGPPLISTELAVAQQDTERALELLLTHITGAKNHGFYWPGVFGIRFGKKTGALLGFTKYERWCTMELIYLRGVDGVEDFLQNYYSDLAAKDIDCTVHPGQVNFVTAAQVRSMYGQDALQKWQSVRERLGVNNQLFANAMTNKWGLTS